MASRRQTLGALSPGQLNSRASMAGAGRVADKGADSKRMTMLGGPARAEKGAVANNAARRQSSMYGPGGKGQKADPRPVGDKGYMQQCIRALIAFLSSQGYDRALTPKALQLPSIKDFNAIVLFLFKRVDPNLALDGKFDEEVVQLYKRLCYPFQISKSSLFAVGAPHTWPVVLAALVWLCELLVYEQGVEALKEERKGSDDGDNMNEVFFEYVTKSYRHFLSGDDRLCESLDQELGRRFADRTADREAQGARLREENAQLRERVARLRSEPTRLEQARRRRADFSSDVGKFEELIASLSAAVSREASRAEARAGDAEEQGRRLGELREENAALEKRVATQVVSKEEQGRMVRERGRLAAAIDAAVQQRADAERRADEAGAASHAAADALEASTAAYNAALHRLQMAPSTAKRAKGADLEARVHRDADPPSETLPLDIRGVVKPAAQRLREQYASKARGLGEELLRLQERHASLEEAAGELREENRVAEREVQRMEERHQLMRDELEAEMRFAMGQVEQLKEEVEVLRGRGTEALAESHARVTAAQAERDEVRRRCDREQAALAARLSQAFSILVSFKEHVEEQLGALHAQVQRAAADVAAAPLPS